MKQQTTLTKLQILSLHEDGKTSTSFRRWDISHDGNTIKLYYFGSQDKAPELEYQKFYEIETSRWNENLVITRDENGPKHIKEIAESISNDSAKTPAKVNIQDYMENGAEVHQSEGFGSDPEDEVIVIDREEKKSENQLMPPPIQFTGKINTIENAVENFKLYEYVMTQIITKDDFQVIMTSQGPKEFMKKTGFRKLSLAFNISSEHVDELLVEIENGWYWKIKVRAIASNGRYSDGVAICTNHEKNKKFSMHDSYATAYTRALSRAISDLVGCGLVSVEEVDA